MIRIRAQAVADELAINFGVSLFGPLQFLENDDASAFTHDKAIAIAIPRAGRTLWVVVACAKSFHGAEAGKPYGNDGGFRAAGDKNVGIPKFDHSP